MSNHRVNLLLASLANFCVTKCAFSVEEYQKELLTSDSYIFAPNHTNNFDGYVIWSLLSKDFDIDTFMFAEFWEDFPILSLFLPIFNVYPITRDKVRISELKREINRLKEYGHSLIMFPQGRHADPKIMLNFPDYHLRTLPLGAFYLSALTSIPLVPIYMEPQKWFEKSVVIYGNPLYPRDYGAVSSSGKIIKDNLLPFANAWLASISELYQSASVLCKRQMREYPIHKNYYDSFNKHNVLKDPYTISNYINELHQLRKLSIQTNITDPFILGSILHIDHKMIEEIAEAKDTYEKYLVRR